MVSIHAMETKGEFYVAVTSTYVTPLLNKAVQYSVNAKHKDHASRLVIN